MKIFCITFAVVGFLSAVLIHLFIYAELAGARPGHKIHAVANMSESILKADLATNGVICVSASDATNFVRMTRDAVGARDGQISFLFHVIFYATALIFILSICVLNVRKRDDKRSV